MSETPCLQATGWGCIKQPHIHKSVNRAYAAVVDQFTLENHVTRLLEIMDEVF